MDSGYNMNPEAVKEGDGDLPGCLRLSPGAVESLQHAELRLPRFSGRAWGAALAALYAVLVVAPLTLILLLRPESDRAIVAEVGVDCSMVGFTIIALQFVITARLTWVEAPFGLDLLVSFHKAMALVATMLLCAHLLLLASVQGWSLLTRLHVRWYLWAGHVALVLLLAHGAMAFWRRVLRLPYARWRRVHNLFALAILLLGYCHSSFIGADVRGGRGAAVWAFLPAIALACFLGARVVRPWLLRRHPFRVVGVAPEIPGVWTVTLEPPKDRPFRFLPGQFQFLRLHCPQISAEEHPFTIASSPTLPGRIRITIKECGDFTAAIGRIPPGALATVHGPFGKFSPMLRPTAGVLVFVAAGVGITPFMSILRYLRDTRMRQNVLLIYCNRQMEDVLFLDELSEMEAQGAPLLKAVHIHSRDPAGGRAHSGRLDADRLLRLCGDIDGKDFYLCCPPAMTAGLIRGLRKRRVRRRQIHTDYFSL